MAASMVPSHGASATREVQDLQGSAPACAAILACVSVFLSPGIAVLKSPLLQRSPHQQSLRRPLESSCSVRSCYPDRQQRCKSGNLLLHSLKRLSD